MSASIYDPATKTLVPFAGTSISMMSELSDVELSAPSNGQVLRYDSSNQAWENADNVSDVSVTPVLSSGTKIATVTVDGSSTDLYAPSGGGGGGGTSDYTDLTNKPQIEGVTLSGNKTASDLGLAKSSDVPSTSDCYKTGDTAFTAIADADYIPVYDTSTTTKKKSTWSNIKSVLKSYFDTLYDKYTLPTATSSVLGGVKIGDNMTIEDGVINPSYLVVANQFNKADLYSTTEKVVGCWTDGRPIYQKTFTGTIPNATTVGTGVSSTISVGASVQDYIKLDFRFIASSKNQMDLSIYSDAQIGVSQSGDVYLNGIRLYGSPNSATNNKNCIVVINSNPSSNGLSYTVTAKYTKTTDSANSFKYADENDYSTSEKIVGTWIDGKPIYQKTISGTYPSNLPTTSWYTTIATISNLDVLVNVSGVQRWYDNSTNYGYTSLPIVDSRSMSSGLPNYTVVIYSQRTNIILNTVGDGMSLFKSQPYFIILQYTKTTD